MKKVLFSVVLTGLLSLNAFAAENNHSNNSLKTEKVKITFIKKECQTYTWTVDGETFNISANSRDEAFGELIRILIDRDLNTGG